MKTKENVDRWESLPLKPLKLSKPGLVAQWIRHLTTNQGIAGSSPAKIKHLFDTLLDTFDFN